MRAAGHVVHTPDLYDGKTFADFDEGVGYAWVEEDLPAARELADTVDGGELFLYPGDRHLFADKSLPDYDESAAKMLRRRVLAFLDNVE